MSQEYLTITDKGRVVDIGSYSLFESKITMNEFVMQAVKAHRRAIEEFELSHSSTITAIAETITDCFRNGGRLYLCGNGGSAADCQHIAGELIGRFKRERNALPALALTTDSSILTCIGNDYCFEDVFARQLQAYLKAGDIVWLISTSGQSANIVAAAKLAKNTGVSVIAFTGKRNSLLEELSDICLCADCQFLSTAQEIHQLAYHIICDIIEENIFRAGKTA